MELFRGYVRLEGKTPLDKFKGKVKLKTLEQVQDCEGYAGVLAEPFVLIDVDDFDQSEKLLDIVEEQKLKCRVVETTRGAHFYFKNDGTWEKCGNAQTLAIGIKADVKVGVSNSLAVVKYKGKVREPLYEHGELDEFDTPPCWMRLVHTSIDVNGMAEGDGRNSALFRYIMPLQAAGFTTDEIRETLKIINDHILEKPLSKSEFETVTRDEAFETQLVPNFYEGKAFLFDEFAKWLIREKHVKRINGELHIYRDGVYVDGLKRIEAEMVKTLPKLSRSKRSEVLEYIDITIQDEEKMSDARYVAFENGVLDVITGKMRPFDPEIIITNRIPWAYRADAKCEVVDNVLRKLACGDEQILALLEEMAGYCMFRRNELRKAFILTGDKGNGKSTYIDMVMNMLGEWNTSSLDLKELGDRFKTAEIAGKLANLGDDIGDEFIGDTAVFKKLVSGDRVTAERKGQDPFAFSCYAKMIFSANTLPRVKDRTGAVLDRLIIIPFNARFSKDDPDYNPYIKYELRERDAVERLICLGVRGLRRVLERKAFSKSTSVEAQLAEYNETNNPILGFYREIVEEHGKDCWVREPIADWYMRYADYCAVNQMQPLSRREFSTQTIRAFKLESTTKRINGKVVRMFVTQVGSV